MCGKLCCFSQNWLLKQFLILYCSLKLFNYLEGAPVAQEVTVASSSGNQVKKLGFIVEMVAVSQDEIYVLVYTSRLLTRPLLVEINSLSLILPLWTQSTGFLITFLPAGNRWQALEYTGSIFGTYYYWSLSWRC